MKDMIFTLNDHEIQILDGPYIKGCKPTSDAREFATTLIQLLDDMRVFAAQIIDEATFVLN